jgi:long-chain fatty acid transport protein
VQIVPGVMLGVGATINMVPGGDVNFYLPIAGEDEYAEVNGTGKWSAGGSVNAGAFYRPFEFLQFGVVYRSENVVKEDQTLTLLPLGRDGGLSVPVKAEINSAYKPQQFVLSAAGRPFEWWTITVEGVYTGWSQYKEPFPKLTPDYGDLDFNGIDYDPAALVVPSDGDLDFADTIVGRVGMEFMPVRHLNIMAGYAYEPTPVPDQTGTTNILDADTNILAFGIGVNFGGEDDQFARIDVGGQYHLVADRTIEKTLADMDPYYQTGNNAALNPAYPVTDVSASYFIGGLSVKFAF